VDQMQLSGSETKECIINIKREHVFRLRVYIESYEGLAIITTVNKESTKIKFTYLACNEQDVFAFLDSIEKEGLIWR